MQYRDCTKRESQSKQVNPGDSPGGQTWKAGRMESRGKVGLGTRCNRTQDYHWRREPARLKCQE